MFKKFWLLLFFALSKSCCAMNVEHEQATLTAVRNGDVIALVILKNQQKIAITPSVSLALIQSDPQIWTLIYGEKRKQRPSLNSLIKHADIK